MTMRNDPLKYRTFESVLVEILGEIRDCLQRMEKRQIEGADEITKQFKKAFEELDEDG